MMKYVLTLLFLFCIATSIAQLKPLKGSYADLPFKFSTSIQYDSAWNIVLNLIEKSGYKIHDSDRTNGSIITGRFNIQWSYEKNGELRDDSALIVVPLYYNKNNNHLYPEVGKGAVLTAEIKIVFKKQIDSTLIIFDIADVQRPDYIFRNLSENYIPYSNFKSTGKFESLLKRALND